MQVLRYRFVVQQADNYLFMENAVREYSPEEQGLIYFLQE